MGKGGYLTFDRAFGGAAMEFGGKRRKAKLKRYRELSEESEYSSRLRFYKIPPMQTIGLEEFEELALSRLKCEFL